jgi:hypothetical protein
MSSDLLSEIEKDLIAVARAIGPGVMGAVVDELKAVLMGAPEDEIRAKAERATTLALFKATYHREDPPR